MTVRMVLTFAFALTALATWATPQDESLLESNTPIRQGPRPLKAGSHGVGRFVPDVKLTSLSGEAFTLADLTKENRNVVIAMTSTSCPLSKKYLPTLIELAKASADELTWLIVNPIANDKLEAMHKAADQFSENTVYVHDGDGEFATRIGALTTTDVVVLDRSRTVVYHGAIDDQYGFGYSLDKPRHRYLANALAAIAAGKTPPVAATEALGCTLEQNANVELSSDVTYHNRISRIVQQHCGNCHRDGGVAPFSLATFDDLEAHAGMIDVVVRRGMMPPWFAGDGTATPDSKANDSSVMALSPWANDCSLAAVEKQDFLAWIAGGMPEGNPDDAPQALQFSSEWQIGEPDAIFEFAEAEPVKATGVMPYKNVDVQTNLTEDKWVQAIEVRPGDPGVVHHVLVFTQGRDDAANERDGYWGIYVPGNSSLIYPKGFAKLLPKGTKLRFQMHYTPNGSATTDKTSVGLVFAKEPPQHEVKVAGIYNDKIKIPAGADNHPEVAKLRIPADAHVLGFLPHMHLRGKACRFELTTVDGKSSTLLDVPRYDFNWQLLYRYREPLELKSGDTIRFTSWYDNSGNNPANPDPTKTVGWGPQTYDEMQVGYVEYYLPGVKPAESPGERQAASKNAREQRNAVLFLRLDVNGDGVITRAEVRERMPDDERASGSIFDRLDVNNDGKLDPSEVAKL